MARREFLARTLVTGAAGAFLGSAGHGDIASLYASGRADDSAAVERALVEWTRDIFESGTPHIYHGEALSEIAMPLGGIGAGQLYLTGSGRLAAWQLVNNFRTAPNDTCGFFAVHTCDVHGNTVARRLHKDSGNHDGLNDIRATCEYPYMRLAYQDDTLPVEITLEAWSPFEPLNARDSGLPGAVFDFRIHNRQNSTVRVSLLASLQNRVGWDGYTHLGNNGLTNIEYEGNENHLERRRDRTMLHLGARTGTQHQLSKPCALFVQDADTALLMRLCANVEVSQEIPSSIKSPDRAVIWLGPGDALPSEAGLSTALEATRAGASLVIADNGSGLLGMISQAGQTEKSFEVFEDFESGDYQNWTIEGDCFGDAPAMGTLPGQQPVSGYRGARLVNTFLNGDSTTGKATSRTFTITRPYIHFLIGGGNHPGRTCMNLVLDDTVAHTATGQNNERLRWHSWDVGDHVGKEAHLEIVDNEKGGWGHINIDHILFSDLAVPPLYEPQTIEAVCNALPFRFIAAHQKHNVRVTQILAPELEEPLSEHKRTVPRCHDFEAFSLKENARTLAASEDGIPLAVIGEYGSGRVLVLNGLYRPETPGPVRRRLAGRILAMLRNAAYQPRIGLPEDAPAYGTLALAALGDTDAMQVEALPQWDDEDAFWDSFLRKGDFSGVSAPDGPSAPGRSWNGALATNIEISANSTRTVTFMLTWHFPNRTRDRYYGWGPAPGQYGQRLGNMYNNWFGSAAEVMEYMCDRRRHHSRATRAFHESLYATTLPRWLLDAVSANIASLRSPLYMWLEDGTVAAYEGTDACCPMNCTHVFNYVMTPAFLFPELERNVRETDLLVQMHPTEHYIPHRTILPLSEPRLGFRIGGPHHPALDGQFGTILKTYREWRQCGDRDWLAGVYPAVKTHLRYLMRTHDVSGDGVIRGEQPNTYDIHTYGSNTFIGSLYLAALRAAEEMALVMDDAGFAGRCRKRFEMSSANYDQTCWNGEYYYNVYDAPDATPDTYNAGNCWGEGCHADQLLGQWWAHILGLGYVLPRAHVRASLEAIYKYCWRGRLDLPEHRQRVFADPWERGLVNCAWPRGGRPGHPILYCDEVWTGIEYEVAALLIQEGLLQEGLQVVKAARDRYTGNQRNPYAEIECGSHYARALSSYSLLTAAAGLEYDAARESLAFAPKFSPHHYQSFFTAADGYGTIRQEYAPQEQRIVVQVVSGVVTLKTLRVEMLEAGSPEITVSRRRASFTSEIRNRTNTIHFATPQTIHEGQDISVTLQWGRPAGTMQDS